MNYLTITLKRHTLRTNSHRARKVVVERHAPCTERFNISREYARKPHRLTTRWESFASTTRDKTSYILDFARSVSGLRRHFGTHASSFRQTQLSRSFRLRPTSRCTCSAKSRALLRRSCYHWISRRRKR